MTDNNRPITLPPELLRRLREDAPRFGDGGVAAEKWIATQAARWGYRQRGALAEPERLTVQEIKNLPKHGENCICEDGDDEILLDGHFSRADLQQLADSIPSNRSNSND